MKINEVFAAHQGEVNVGRYGCFVRLCGCNLRCEFCDTKYAYDEYIDLTNKQLYEQLKTFNYIVFTGGEPLLQQDELNELIHLLQQHNEDVVIEIETNGTIKPKLSKGIRYNVSPKLSNSGNEYDKRIDKKVLQHHVMLKSNFKFVVETIEDVDEVNLLVEKIQIPKQLVFLMPKGETRDKQMENMEGVIKMAKVYGYNFSPRVHVLIFDKMRGV